jgi:hypothetical protein
LDASAKEKWGRAVVPFAGAFAKTLRATEFHFLTMLRAYLQGVDLKVDRDFGEGQGYWYCALIPTMGLLQR